MAFAIEHVITGAVSAAIAIFHRFFDKCLEQKILETGDDLWTRIKKKFTGEKSTIEKAKHDLQARIDLIKATAKKDL